MTELLRRARIAGLDFQTAFDELFQRLQVEYGGDFANLTTTDPAVALLDLMAYATDTLAFAIDRAATDSYDDTVVSPYAASLILRARGYKRRSRAPAALTLSLVVPETQAATVTLPAGSQIRHLPTGYIFTTASAAVWSVPDTGGVATKTVEASQTRAVAETFTSTGEPRQKYSLRRALEGEGIAFGSIQVTVNGSPYTQVDFLRPGVTNTFEADYCGEAPVVRFGTATTGGLPPLGAPIRITYSLTRGRDGNVAAGTAGGNPVFELVSPLLVGGEAVELEISSTQATGGDEEQSLEAALDAAPRFFNARDVAVTRSDYLALAGNFADPVGGRVAAASAFVARRANADLVLVDRAAEIRSAVRVPAAAVEAALADIVDAQTTIAANAAAITSELGTAATEMATAVTTLGTVQSGLRTMATQGAQVLADAGDANAQALTARSAIQAIATDATDTLTAGTKTTLLNALGVVLARLSSATTAGGLTQSTAGSLQAPVAEVLSTLQDTVGTGSTPDATGTHLERIAAFRASITTAMLAQTDPLAVIDTQIVDDATGAEALVESALSALETHFDAVLADAGQANLVQIPILARDASGFYAAPSVALMRALQTYLEARCDATHTVEVVSGARALIPAVMTVKLFLRAGSAVALAISVATAAINALLRSRRFGQYLYNSELVQACTALEGVAHAVATINGHTVAGSTVASKLDASGTLTVTRQEVITRGTLTVTAEFEVLP